MKTEKKHMDVIYTPSLRELVDKINDFNNSTDTPILKNDIVKLFRDHDTGLFYIVFYHK